MYVYFHYNRHSYFVYVYGMQSHKLLSTKHGSVAFVFLLFTIVSLDIFPVNIQHRECKHVGDFLPGYVKHSRGRLSFRLM